MPSPFAPPRNPVPAGWWSSGDSQRDINYRADTMEQEEYRRYDEGLAGLETAFTESSNALSKGIDVDLLFSRAADAGGLRARQAMDRLRSSIGGRGIDPNSGAAGGLLARIGLQQQSDIVGAKRDIAIEDQRARQIGAAQMFANALNLAQFRASPVPQIGLDARMAGMELAMRERSERRADETQRRASKDNLFGNIIGGVLGLAGRI